MTQDRKNVIRHRAAHRARGGISRHERIAPSSIVLLVLTPICVVASILLPNFVSAFNNDQIFSTSKNYSIPVEEIVTAAEVSAQASDLRGKEAVLRALEVLSGDHYKVSSIEGFRMKREQVLEEAASALRTFSENGFGVKPDKVNLHDITQELAISTNGGNIVRTWMCTYIFAGSTESKGDLVLVIDDASGKAVLYELDSYVASGDIYIEQLNDADVVEKWAKMWGSYLGLELDSDSLYSEMDRIGDVSYFDYEDGASGSNAVIELSVSLLLKESKTFLNLNWIQEDVVGEGKMRLFLNVAPQTESNEDVTNNTTDELDESINGSVS